MKNTSLSSLCVLLFALFTPALAATISASEKASLQAAMAQHIDRQTVEGVFLHVDFKAGAVQKLAPAKAHPMMLKMDDNFVLCTSFRRANGSEVNIDFYVARKGPHYAVFQTEVDNRSPLMALIKAGRVVPIQ